jgi:hypothetical protein
VRYQYQRRAASQAVDRLKQLPGLLAGPRLRREKGIQRRQGFDGSQAHLLSGVQSPAPTTTEYSGALDTLAAQQLAPALRLLAAELIEIALSAAVSQLKIRRITRAWRSGMAQQQNGAAFTQRGPGVFIAGLDRAAQQAQRPKPRTGLRT